jgi:hypothetical protein
MAIRPRSALSLFESNGTRAQKRAQRCLHRFHLSAARRMGKIHSWTRRIDPGDASDFTASEKQQGKPNERT